MQLSRTILLTSPQSEHVQVELLAGGSAAFKQDGGPSPGLDGAFCDCAPAIAVCSGTGMLGVLLDKVVWEGSILAARSAVASGATCAAIGAAVEDAEGVRGVTAALGSEVLAFGCGATDNPSSDDELLHLCCGIGSSELESGNLLSWLWLCPACLCELAPSEKLFDVVLSSAGRATSTTAPPLLLTAFVSLCPAS